MPRERTRESGREGEKKKREGDIETVGDSDVAGFFTVIKMQAAFCRSECLLLCGR